MPESSAGANGLRPKEFPIIRKSRYSGFCNTGLEAYLRARKIRNLLFTGVATNLSVTGTLFEAVNHGYRTVVVSDACTAATDKLHRASLETLGQLGEVATAAEIVDQLSG